MMGEREPGAKALLEVIASILEELVRKGEEQRRNSVHTKMTKFHGLRAPSIPLSDYLQRIAQFSGCSTECFILMLIYIDRLVTNKDIPLDALNVHRLVITATLLAAKFFDDHYLDNAHYSAVGGLPRNEINELELEMLFLLGFNLFVTTDNYNTYHGTLKNMSASKSIPRQPEALPAPQAPVVPMHQAVAAATPMGGVPSQAHMQQAQAPIINPQQQAHGGHDPHRQVSGEYEWVHVDNVPGVPGSAIGTDRSAVPNVGMVPPGFVPPSQQMYVPAVPNNVQAPHNPVAYGGGMWHAQHPGVHPNGGAMQQGMNHNGTNGYGKAVNGQNAGPQGKQTSGHFVPSASSAWA